MTFAELILRKYIEKRNPTYKVTIYKTLDPDPSIPLNGQLYTNQQDGTIDVFVEKTITTEQAEAIIKYWKAP